MGRRASIDSIRAREAQAASPRSAGFVYPSAGGAGYGPSRLASGEFARTIWVRPYAPFHGERRALTRGERDASEPDGQPEQPVQEQRRGCDGGEQLRPEPAVRHGPVGAEAGHQRRY
ncbi:hypothetical protein NUW54_g5793 [Trametes sanguinea]|uniref:Uncharacterized protein n=1 Tax=Trametes sanguinea TaxID=158606 RepID=A0ACC1PVR3_9APHY|nr:hypothetical protein NUW54_g5793 [Trametes sanguinea]